MQNSAKQGRNRKTWVDSPFPDPFPSSRFYVRFPLLVSAVDFFLAHYKKKKTPAARACARAAHDGRPRPSAPTPKRDFRFFPPDFRGRFPRSKQCKTVQNKAMKKRRSPPGLIFGQQKQRETRSNVRSGNSTKQRCQAQNRDEER